MCGIIYAKNLKDAKPVNSLIKLMYLNQKERGTEGYGFVGLSKDTIDTHRALYERDLLACLEANEYDEILLHHRLPTSTKNTLPSTHPFIVDLDRHRFYFTHNGIIWNDDELQKQHTSQGISYKSIESETNKINDSEALAWEFAHFITKRKNAIEVVGTAAFICLETDSETNRASRLYFYRDRSSALKIYRDKTLFVLSSDGEWGENTKADRLYFYDYQNRNIKNAGRFEITSPDHASLFEPNSLFSYRLHECDTETRDEILHLVAERDHLLTTGDYQQAAELDDEIWFLEHQRHDFD